MHVNDSLSKRRAAVVLNNGLLVLTLLVSLTGQLFDWSLVTKVCFCLLVTSVIATFFPLHIRTGLWRLAHAKIESLDERETQQVLKSVRQAYVVFSIVSLLLILTWVVFGLGSQTQQLAVFWVLLYLAHTLPSSILAWTINRVPTQGEE